VLTSLLRAHIGYRTWRATHWLAYASWPVALVHALGTGSDARLAWLQLVAAGCTVSVALALAARFALGPGAPDRRLAGGAAAIALLLGIVVWYRGGPAAQGWAARAGTPVALLAHRSSTPAATRTTLVSLPRTFRSQFAGRLTATRSGDETVDVRIDGTLRSGVKGRLRLVLEGFPLEGGGVSMTASGVAFAVAGSPSVYEGRIDGLDGSRISAKVSSGSNTIDLQIGLQLRPGRSHVTGVIQGTAA
jgi:hypothetical protein